MVRAKGKSPGFWYPESRSITEQPCTQHCLTSLKFHALLSNLSDQANRKNFRRCWPLPFS